jgi:superfamily II DNA or RNA helicase
MTRNFEILKKAVLDVSSAQTWEEAVKEWKLSRIDILPGSTCSCSHAPITDVCFMANSKTGVELPIGNCCVTKFFGMDYSEQFKEMKRENHERLSEAKFRAANPGVLEKIEEWQTRTTVPFYQSFLETYKRCIVNGWNLSEKQQQIFEGIRYQMTGEVPSKVKRTIAFLESLKTANTFQADFMATVKRWAVEERPLTEKQQKIFRDILSANGKTEADLVLVDKDDLVKEDELNFYPLTPREWQRTAFSRWYNLGGRAVIEASTGSGKTYLGFMAIQQFPELRWLVVVPTIPLQRQWEEGIHAVLPGTKVGLICGGVRNPQRVTIAVVNSIRGLDLNDFDGVILDEAHRYMSECNWLIMDRNTFDKVLAISATIEREDGEHAKLLARYPVAYTLSQKAAIEKKLIAPYGIVNVSVELTEEERKKYDELQETVTTGMRIYEGDFSRLMANLRDPNAREAIKAISRRRMLVQSSRAKTDAAFVVALKQYREGRKVMVFSEFTESADDLFSRLEKAGVPVGKYHSKMKLGERREMVAKFAKDEIMVMISCRCLDEGLDVPAADVAIVMAGSSVKRQMIQRLGRVLRYQEDKEAMVFQFFVKDTIDVSWMRKRTAPFRDVATKIETKNILDVM